MNSPSFNPELSAEELEETVELPVLPDGVVQAADGETAELKAVAETVTAAEPRGSLENNLRSLTDNLRTLEEKLRAKSEQLSIFEREVGARDRRIAELEVTTTRREQEIKEAGVSTAALLEQIGGLTGRLADAEATSQQHAGAHAQIVIEQTSREFALSHAMARLTDLNTRTERYAEVRQSLEGQRHVYEGMVGEREAQLQSVQEQLAALQLQLNAGSQQAAAQAQALQADLDFQRDRAADFERQILQAQSRIGLLEQEARQQLANAEQAAARQQTLSETLAAEKTLVSELNSSVEGLRRDNVSAQAQLAVTMRNIVKLETELRDHRDLAEAQQEQLSIARLRADNGAADLAAAEERLRTTENESRQREAKIEALLVSEAQLRERIAQLEHSLGDRNALIGRLEGEAASSAAVLGNIQHNLESLGNEAAKQTSQSGSHAIQRVTGEKLARLFVRSKGETGIVHVLGRRTTIGRTPDNDLQIDAESISRHHAVVLYTNDATVIEDLNSTNGVFVNGSKVNRCTLAEGDTITIGVTTFRFVLKPVTDRATQN
jgi:chromosome segregation ATPase